MAVHPYPPARREPADLPTDPARRERLRRLDDLLDRLEWVNERGLEELPDTLVAALRRHGITCTSQTNAAALIKAVWRLQEPLLRPMAPPRRREALDVHPLPRPGGRLRIRRRYGWD